MARKFKGSSIKRGNYVEMYGFSDMLNRIEDAGGKVDQAVKKCVDNSLKVVGNHMQNFMLAHKFTGETLESYTLLEAEIKDNVVSSQVGYAVKEGGLPAIFLDVGTPKQKPYFFRYYAVENNRTEIQMIQQETLSEILRGLM